MNKLLKKARERVWLAGDPERDHSTGLVVFGTLGIVLGFLAFAGAMLLIVLTAATGLGGMKTVPFWAVIGSLFFLTGWFSVMGLGSIKARRWARVLVLVGAWVTIFFGTLIMAVMLYLLPGIFELLADSELLSPKSSLTVISVAIAIYFILELVLPMAAIVFYSLQGVRTTCERLNPDPSWTDRCPLPLLAMAFICALGCLSIIFGASMNYVVFLFGKVLTGWQGFLVVLAISVVCGYVGWGAFTRRMHAWWLAYTLILLLSASLMLTFSELDMFTLYSAMGYETRQVLQLSHLEMLNPAVFTFVTCVWGILTCIYLVWVRDCFQPERDASEVKSYRQRKAEEETASVPEPARPRMRLET